MKYVSWLRHHDIRFRYILKKLSRFCYLLFNHRQGKTSTLSKFGAILSSRVSCLHSASLFNPSHFDCTNNKFNPTCLTLWKHHIISLRSSRSVSSNFHQCIISTDDNPSLRIESFALVNLRGTSTKLN